MLMHTLDLDDREALRVLDCRVAGRLGWRDAGLHFDGAGDVLGDYEGVPVGEVVAQRVPHYSTDPVAANSLPVVRRIGKVIHFTPTPLTVALLFLAQTAESYTVYESEADVEVSSTSQTAESYALSESSSAN